MVRPDYYDKFKCTADKCDFTCCQEWKIAVDDETAATWKKVQPPANMATRRKNLERFTQYKDRQRVISLENNVCPFLDDNRLCKLVCAYGDEILSETCRVFPREIHEFDDRTEATLMPCCPEVIDFLNEAACFNIIDIPTPAYTEKQQLFEVRNMLIDILNSVQEGCSYELRAIFYVLFELLDKPDLEISDAKNSIPEIIKLIREMDTDKIGSFTECNELFLDLVDNYRRQEIYTRFLNPLIQESENLSHNQYPQAFIEAFSEFEPLFHKYLAQEVYADLVNRDSQLEDLVIRFEWICMEYVLIRHMCYLHFNREKYLTYKDVRSYLVLASRIMGYEQEDIYEYMANCFEDMIWEWGYLGTLLLA